MAVFSWLFVERITGFPADLPVTVPTNPDAVTVAIIGAIGAAFGVLVREFLALRGKRSHVEYEIEQTRLTQLKEMTELVNAFKMQADYLMTDNERLRNELSFARTDIARLSHRIDYLEKNTKMVVDAAITYCKNRTVDQKCPVLEMIGAFGEMP